MNKGLYLKNKRLEKKYSLRTLSSITGINYQKINRFENDEAELTEEELKRLEEFLEIDLDIETGYSFDVQKMFEEFYLEYVYSTLDFEKYQAKIQNQTRKISDEIVFMIMDYGMLVMKGHYDEAEVLERKIDKYSIRNLFIKSVYLDFKGCRLLLTNNQEEALKVLKNALLIAGDENVSAMIHYHNSFILKEKNCLREAMKEVSLAQEIFKKTYNFRRMFGSALIMAGVELRNREYEEALAYYESCISISAFISIEQSEIAKLYRNMTWLMIRKEDYKQAGYYLKKARKLNDKHKFVSLYSIWINYKKTNYEDAKKEIRKCKCIISDQETLMILELLEKLCSTRDKTPSLRTFNYAKKVYKQIEKKNDVDRTLFYLDIVLDIAERRNDVESMIYIMKTMIKLLKK